MGGITPLMYAAGNDIPDLVTLLVRRAGADVNLRSTRIQHTPLTWASCSGSMAAVTALLSEGAELDYPSSEGRTALMVACRFVMCYSVTFSLFLCSLISTFVFI